MYLFRAWDSPAKAASRFFSVWVPAYLLAFGASSIFSKEEAGCLQTGHLKSAGSSSPSYIYPHTFHFHLLIFLFSPLLL